MLVLYGMHLQSTTNLASIKETFRVKIGTKNVWRDKQKMTQNLIVSPMTAASYTLAAGWKTKKKKQISFYCLKLAHLEQTSLVN